MTEEPWEVLLRAWLHDPVDKAADLRGHERRAREYAEIVLGRPITDSELKGGMPDQLASAYERLPMPDARGRFDELGVLPEDGRLTVFHPLSAAPSLISLPLKTDRVRQVLAAAFPGEMQPKLRFLTLWRKIPDLIARICEGYRQQPAETRNPDHTLWQHLDTTAAMAWALHGGAGAAALLSFKLGPVQPFIEASRSLRDLLTSSWLISRLTFAALTPVLYSCGPTALVFPALRGMPAMDQWLVAQGVSINPPDPADLWRPSIPHRFLALVPGSRLSELKEQVVAAAQQEWHEIASLVHDSLQSQWKDRYPGWDRLWDAQIESYWNVRATGFRIADAKPEDLLGREQVNTFAPLSELGEGWSAKPGHWQQAVEISQALMEAHSMIRFIPSYRPAGDVPPKCPLLGTFEQMGPAKLSESDRFWKEVGDNEGKDRLCAVSLVKRHALRGRVIFPDTEELARRNEWADGKGKYYAVLMLDGDEMGAWLSGAKSPKIKQVLHEKIRRYHERAGRSKQLEIRRPVSPALHGSISEGLGSFANRIVPRIVDECRGALIYSGGDDVLAALPVDTAIDCARQLRFAFSADEVLGASASCSAGLVVAHCKEDLRDVLRMARSAESKAKHAGRDRLAIVAMRRSGEHAEAVCCWPYTSRIQEMADEFRRGATDRWTYQLRAELHLLTGLPEAAFASELQRIMKRSEAPSALRDLVDVSLCEFLVQAGDSNHGAALAGFVTLCQTASFLTRKGD